MSDIINPFPSGQDKSFCPFLSQIAIVPDQFGAHHVQQVMTPCNPLCAIYDAEGERCSLLTAPREKVGKANE